MQLHDFTHRTNGTFVKVFDLTAWADLYDLSAGHWHAMLRKNVLTAIANYEWSTERETIEYAETFAHGEITFTLNLEIGDTLMLGATIVEFGATDGPVIGGSLAATLANLLVFLGASEDADILLCEYSVTSGSVLNITYKSSGSLGNAFPFETTVAGSTVSGETLNGGSGMLTLFAPLEDIGAFDGDYVYDVRFQGDDMETYVPIVGGMITFERGVTRDTQEPETNG